MKKCPECGNPSYDGAPVCGNCGYEFPKMKTSAPKKEIFDKAPVPKKKKQFSDEESTIEIIKENKIIIGAIILITIIVICGMFLTSSSNHNPNQTIQSSGDMVKFSDAGFSFSYPNNWQQINESDSDHEGSVFLKNENNTIIQYYNVSNNSTSLKEINQDRISHAQESGESIDTVQTITLDGRNASDIILENDGNYTRYVSLFSNGELYVFKISGDSMNNINSTDINSVLETADIA